MQPYGEYSYRKPRRNKAPLLLWVLGAGLLLILSAVVCFGEDAGHAHWEPKENGESTFRWNSLDSSMPTHRGGAEKPEIENGDSST